MKAGWRLVSPLTLGLLALALWGLYAAAAAGGWQETVAVLSGTPVPGTSPGPATSSRAVLLVGAWAGAIVLAPILGLAAVIFAVLLWLVGDQRPATDAEAEPAASSSAPRPPEP